VQPDAPREIILSSYRTLMQQLNAHPDRGGDNQVAAQFNRAYSVLSDESKRHRYDRELQKHLRDTTSLTATGSYVMYEDGLISASSCLFCAAEHSYKETVPKDAFCNTCKSPLYPAGKNYIDESDQRKMLRVGKKCRVSYYTRWPQLRAYTATTDNISQEGMMFVSSKRLSVDSLLKINGAQFQTIARIVHCRQAGSLFDPEWQIGVEFVTLHLKSSRGVFVSDVT
jgi:curved DNA-binding protein CbpA